MNWPSSCGIWIPVSKFVSNIPLVLAYAPASTCCSGEARPNSGSNSSISAARPEVDVGGERFQLRHQSAQDVRRYDICKDLVRMESFCERYGATGGVLVLTNDSSYWCSRRRQDTFDAAFDLADLGTLNGKLQWAERIGAETTRGRQAPLVIAGRARPRTAPR